MENRCSPNKKRWTEAEDACLIDYVKKKGERNWDAIAKATGLGRCGKSCRSRWLDHLKPNLKKTPITPEEEHLICQLQAKMGNKWAKIVKHLPGRTDNEIKNFWNCKMKKKKSQRVHVPLEPAPLALDPSSMAKLQHYERSQGMALEDIIPSLPDLSSHHFDLEATRIAMQNSYLDPAPAPAPLAPVLYPPQAPAPTLAPAPPSPVLLYHSPVLLDADISLDPALEFDLPSVSDLDMDFDIDDTIAPVLHPVPALAPAPPAPVLYPASAPAPPSPVLAAATISSDPALELDTSFSVSDLDKDLDIDDTIAPVLYPAPAPALAPPSPVLAAALSWDPTLEFDTSFPVSDLDMSFGIDGIHIAFRNSLLDG